MNTITSAVDRIAAADVSTVPRHYGLRSVLGFAAWTRLPEAVRFTMTVTHPFFGEMFYQTGRFRAAGEQL
jgi:hypothetical protein